MTADEAFALFMQRHSHADLPWEQGPGELHETFMAGWQAHEEASKQSVIFAEPECVVTAIYNLYPRKVGKQAAIKAIRKAIKDRSATWVKDAVSNYAKAVAAWPADDKRFIPHPATWFNEGRYDDDPKEWLRGAAAIPSAFSTSH